MRKLPDRALREKFEMWYAARYLEAYPLARCVPPATFSLQSTRPLRYQKPDIEAAYQAFKVGFHMGLAHAA